MSSTEVFLISAARAIIEVALFALLGQGVLSILAGATRERNSVYRLLRTVSRPAVAATRVLLPRSVSDRHLPVVAFLLLFWLWIVLAIAKRYICVSAGSAC